MTDLSAEYLDGKVYGLEKLQAALLHIYVKPKLDELEDSDWPRTLAEFTNLRAVLLGSIYEKVGNVSPDDLFIKGVQDVFTDFITHLESLK